jgi:hypothetical protein
VVHLQITLIYFLDQLLNCFRFAHEFQ